MICAFTQILVTTAQAQEIAIVRMHVKLQRLSTCLLSLAVIPARAGPEVTDRLEATVRIGAGAIELVVAVLLDAMVADAVELGGGAPLDVHSCLGAAALAVVARVALGLEASCSTRLKKPVAHSKWIVAPFVMLLSRRFITRFMEYIMSTARTL